MRKTLLHSLMILTAAIGLFALVPWKACSQPAAPEIVGRWSGVLLVSGLRLHLAVNFTGGSGTSVGGELISLDQNDARVPLADVSVAGRAVHFRLPSINAAFDGLLDTDGNAMEGEWVQNGSPAGLSLNRDGAAQHAPPHYVFGPPIDVRAPVSPMHFRADGKELVAYELWLTNLGTARLHMQKIEVLLGSETIAVLDKQTLEQAVQQRCGYSSDGAALDAGCVSVARMWVALPENSHRSMVLYHRITVDGQVIDASAVRISERNALTLSPPLRGGPWKALNGPGEGSGHWATMIASGGMGRFPDRFAIDWVKVGVDGKTFQETAADDKNYFAFGQQVLAVSDATVVNVLDGVPQNTPGSHAVDITPENVCGNSVILQLATEQFAFYCHLQAGSLRVKVGQRVHTGDVIGLVGNSGDSSEPHLHFQISNTNSIAGSESLPYQMGSFEVHKKDAASEMRSNELPTRDATVSFPK